MKHYQEHGYLRVDPTVRLGITQTTSILWNDETFKTAPELWDDARSFGLNVGIAQPVWGADGSFGLLSLAREAEQLTAAEENLQCLRMAWMAQTTHAIIGSMLKSFLNLPVQAQLTQRELEILCWTAEGKTASEIGLILGLSDRTINFHINNFVRKLECNNKIQAAVKAVAIGLLKS
jgi:LuxR family quorum-sensing system transcriptional regulator SolR